MRCGCAPIAHNRSRSGLGSGGTHPRPMCVRVCANRAQPMRKKRGCSEVVPKAAVGAAGLQPCDAIHPGSALRAVVIPLCAAVLDVFAHVFTSAYTGTGDIVLKVSMWVHIESLNILSPVHLFGGETHASIIRGRAGAGDSLGDRRGLPRARGVTPSRRSSSVYQSPTTDRDQDWGRVWARPPSIATSWCAQLVHNQSQKKITSAAGNSRSRSSHRTRRRRST